MQAQQQQQTVVIQQGQVATGNCPVCRVVRFLCYISRYTVHHRDLAGIVKNNLLVLPE